MDAGSRFKYQFRVGSKGGFEGEEIEFDIITAAVMSGFSAAEDDAVAGNNDGDGVLSVGRADGPVGRGFCDGSGQLSVASCFSAGDVLQSLPDLLLKGASVQTQGYAEAAAVTFEVGIELLPDLCGEFRSETGIENTAVPAHIALMSRSGF